VSTPTRKHVVFISAGAIGATALVLRLFGLGPFATTLEAGQKAAEEAARNIPDDCSAELCAGRRSGELVPLAGSGVVRVLDGGGVEVCECP